MSCCSSFLLLFSSFLQGYSYAKSTPELQVFQTLEEAYVVDLLQRTLHWSGRLQLVLSSNPRLCCACHRCCAVRGVVNHPIVVVQVRMDGPAELCNPIAVRYVHTSTVAQQ